MDPKTPDDQITHDFPPFFRVRKSGHIERYLETDFVPPSLDPATGVQSKDVTISPETAVSARLYLPRTTKPNQKLPLIIYFHGGAFSIQSAFSSLYHNHLNSLVGQANAIAVSVDYRLAPENPLPACYDDAWAAMQWVALHIDGGHGPEPWLSHHVDFRRVFLAGDSAGANIAHNMAIRSSLEKARTLICRSNNAAEESSKHINSRGHKTGDELEVHPDRVRNRQTLKMGLEIHGIILVHPFFGGDKPDRLWDFICPVTIGSDDPRLNPSADMDLLAKLDCKKVLVCTAENDTLRKRGLYYYKALKKSGWKGVTEISEAEGEGHVFHLFDPTCDNAISLVRKIVYFINQDLVLSSM